MSTKKYVEQLERVKRLLYRFERIGAGIDHSQHSVNYDDDVHSFFQNCYHLKDWIKNDPYCAAWQCVETLINENQNLKLCADLCNAQKHFTLTKPRSKQSPQFDGRMIRLNITECGDSEAVQIALSWTVVTTSLGTIDALDLAKHCVQAWESFVVANDP